MIMPMPAPAPPERPSTLERLGAAGLGGLLGLILGILAFAARAAMSPNAESPALVAVVTLAVALLGFVAPRLLWTVVEGGLHLFSGSVLVWLGVGPDAASPRWLRIAFVVGAVGALVLRAVLRSGLTW